MRQAEGVPSFHPEFDQLFAFGIDPDPGQLPQDKRSDWPERAEVQRYNLRVRQAIGDLSNQVSEDVLSVALERHRLMPCRAIRLSPPSTVGHAKEDIPLVASLPPSPTPIRTVIEIPGGAVTLGQRRAPLHGQYQFGWDNEFDGHEVSVSAFAMSKYKVTNGEYLQEFVRAGAKPPHFWTWGEEPVVVASHVGRSALTDGLAGLCHP